MQRNVDILNELKLRPGMYTGENTLTSIAHFLQGYSFALMLHDLPREGDCLILPEGFDDWVAYRQRFHESTSGWCKMICERTQSDREAIDRFFELLSEFENREPRIVATVKRVRGDLVTYTDDPGFFLRSQTEDGFPEQFFPTLDSFSLTFGMDCSSLVEIEDESWVP